MKMQHVKEEDLIESLGNQALLAKIDKLREINIGSLVPLPQLVVVGDQSSGKSSVLESLTGFSFPRATTLCTRYATQITCQRSDFRGVEISILPAANASNLHQEAVKKFYRKTDGILEDASLAQIFQDANRAMGIRGSDEDDYEDMPTFSEDVLKIVISSPEENHLTVIDVPGIFRTATEGLTTDQDIKTVNNMVKEYMKDHRTIILAVIPCNVDIATQEILKLARDADPNGIRTLGVLTKPDLAVEQATKHDAINLVNGNRNVLRLGYCVVRNRGADEDTLTLKDRNQKEANFFREDPWSQLAGSGRTGIQSLKRRLQELLADISKKAFPNVKAEILKKLVKSRKALEEMGPDRADTDTQRVYLGKLSDNFQRLAQYALDGYYTHSEIFHGNPQMRLITRIVNLNYAFAEAFCTRGHMRSFAADGEMVVPSTKDLITHEDESMSDGYLDQFGDIHDIIGDSYDCPYPQEDSILSYIEKELINGRGRELATVPGTLLAGIFKEQTRKWEPLVIDHVSRAICVVHKFIRELLEETCHDEAVREELWENVLLEELRRCYKRAMDHATWLLRVERESWPITVNHYFSASLDKCRADRLMELLRGMFLAQNDKIVLSRDMLQGAQSRKTISERTRDDIHDALMSYYEVSRKRFVDVVCQQVVDYLLLSGNESPFKVFCNERVNFMSHEQLDMIAGEDLATRRQRKLLTNDIKRLEAAMKVLRG